MKVKKGDKVKILSGKDRGKTGIVSKVLIKENKVLVEGINLYKKHIRPKTSAQKGEIITVSRPIYASKVMVICKNCSKPTRIGFQFLDDKKVRYCKKCKSLI
ncbi:MAG: 50S ribosomal protein L24 [Patescibacteria group bacterium]|nr:50S ribosomal protein L24 [Patescibacteria group bacterium]MCX7589892.1 50S ribosomal protein L24 [Patescibacteria group bacterium]MDW8279573.1 50S ribosomal protein L24 [bacterium]